MERMPMYETQQMGEYFVKVVPWLCFFDDLSLNLWPQ